MPESTPDQLEVISRLNRYRVELEDLMPDEETKRLISITMRLRNEAILAGLDAGLSERTIARHAGVARGWIWKLKRTNGR